MTLDTVPPTVVICTAGELFGGVERHILLLAGALRDKGIGTLLIMFHDGELAAQARDHGFEIVVLPARNRSLLSTCRQIAHILSRRQADVVHVHGYKAMVFCGIAQRWHRFGIVKTEHGLPERATGRWIENLRTLFYHFLDRTVARRSGAVICYVTQDLLANQAATQRGQNGIVIHNGVACMDRERVPRARDLRKDRFNLLVVGRLDAVKAHNVAIEALARPDMPPDIDLYIVGSGPRAALLRELARARGLAHRVHFTGFRRDVHGFLGHCDALLMPSLHEGLPYTLLEAMALGTPVIASRVGGLAEVVQHEVTGLLVAPGDARALANAVQRLHRDHALRLRLGEQAMRLQRSRYSLDTMTAAYLEVYRKVASQNS